MRLGAVVELSTALVHALVELEVAVRAVRCGCR